MTPFTSLWTDQGGSGTSVLWLSCFFLDGQPSKGPTNPQTLPTYLWTLLSDHVAGPEKESLSLALGLRSLEPSLMPDTW